MNITQSFNLIASAILLSTVAACSQTNAPVDSANQVRAFGPTENVQGSQAAALTNNTWLISSESQGLQLIDEMGNSHTLQSGNFETLSVKALDNGHYLVASIDNEADQAVIFKLQKDAQWQLKTLSRITPPKAKPEAVCLFSNSTTHAVSAFVSDARGLIRETLVYDVKNNHPLNLELREFAGISDTSGCAVDDHNKTLYLSEGEVGIWRINADAESRADKTPVALMAPFGNLVPEIGGLSTTSDGSLWFTTTEDNTLHRYESKDKRFSSWQFAGDLALESAAVHFNNTKADIVFYDDESGHYVKGFINTPYQEQVKPTKQAVTYITAQAQTDAVRAFGDAADDPAIWINTHDKAHSLILGTDKRRGLMVYNLAGNELQALETGRLNNVDVRQNNSIDNPAHTWITGSNRTHNSISVYTVDTQNKVQHLAELPTTLTEIYGMCMYSSSTGNYVFMNDKSGLFQQYKLTGNATSVNAKLVREFNVPSQPEGCSADDKTGELFLGEEDEGIWFIGAEPTAGTQPVMLQTINDMLVDDIEGMEIYHATDTRYLVVSSQGDNSYVLYKIIDGNVPRLEFAGKFAISNNLERAIDGVSETDGLTVTATPLPGYPEGVLIVQDGYNRMPQAPQNFKIIDWREVKKALK
ncbi:phytase [Pseudoalteromonas lipolytica]|uniref:phytase n=1 Tax=Pseudoalteromonas lipolytica TaxID=570156 RepID=UPI003BA23E83